MALSDDVRSLADRSLVGLSSGHDFYVHTKLAWRVAGSVFAAGPRFTIRNKITGSLVDQDDLIRRGQDHATVYLRSFTFQYFVSQFEDFLFDLIGIWLTAHPQSLAGKSVPFGTVMEAPDKAAITRAVVDEELNGLKYKRVADWFRYLDKLVRLDHPSSDEIESLAEIKASRDILVHNRGIVNAIYVSKAGGQARYAIGEVLELPEDYHRASWELILKVVRDVSSAAVAKA
jgi:hypothetical protein